MIIGIHGRKQSGKSSISKFIKDLLPEKKIQEIAFAKPLKEMINEIFNIPMQNMYGSDTDKDYPLCTWGEIFSGRCLSEYEKFPHSLLSAREVMQVIGTDVMRRGKLPFVNVDIEKQLLFWLQQRFGPNTRPFDSIWVDLAFQDVKNLQEKGDVDIFVVSDMRFTNEFNATKNNGGKTIRLYRDSGCDESIVHESERQLEEISDEEFDFVLTERENQNLKQLKVFAIKVLMSCELLATGGLVV